MIDSFDDDVKTLNVPGKEPGMIDKAWDFIDVSGVRVGQIWRHNKTGTEYLIRALSIDEMRLVPVVTYEGHPDNIQRVWTRDLEVFIGKREDDGTSRFTLLHETMP